MTAAAAALTPAPIPWPSRAGVLLAEMRARAVRVHAITNAAAQVLTANLLLAAGAIPSLTVAPDEVEAFTRRAGALLVNLGTLDAERREGILRAIEAAGTAGRPFVLDPVFVDASPLRLAFARRCLAAGPAVVRCNAAEFEALAGESAEDRALVAFARSSGCVVALTGAVDRITDGSELISIANGHPLMTKVTAMGCAATALIAAFAAVEPDPLAAAVGALLCIDVAGEIAGGRCEGPGTFPPAFLDALAALDAATIAAHARVS